MSTEQILERLMREYGDSVNILMRQSRLSSLD